MPNAIDSNLLYFSMFNNTKEAILITDTNNKIVKVNSSFSRITGYDRSELIGCDPKKLSSGKHDKLFYRRMWSTLLLNGIWQGEIWNRRKNGEIYREWLTIRSIKNEKGEVVNYLAMFEDISETGNAARHVDYLLNYDTLTELPNRHKFLKIVSDELLKAQPTAFLSIDISRFKNINNTVGYNGGDIILREVASRLRSACIKFPCVIGRYGNDEFVVSLSNVRDSTQIDALINVICEIVQSPINVLNTTITPLLVFGVSKFPVDGNSVSELMQKASTAMSYAKKYGNSNVHHYSSQMITVLSERVDLESRLYRAVKMNEFEVYLQPKTLIDGKTLIGAEALVRWNDNGKIVLPSDFIPLAEEIGLITQIGEHVMKTACSFHKSIIKKYSKLPDTFKIAVNISIAQLRTEYDLDSEDVNLFCCDTSTSNLCMLDLELTESVAMLNQESSIKMLHALKMKGSAISIDDFGTGYSSLSYLRKMPIDALKIDQSFVKNIGKNDDDCVIINTIIAMAKNLKLKVIAEGVETEYQRKFLEDAGCDMIQGYLVSKPLPMNEFEEQFLSQYNGKS